MTRKTKRAVKRPTPRRPAREASKAPGSVITADFRERYKQHGGSSGDELSVRLRKHLATADGTINLAKLKALAELNGVWSDAWSSLNVGQQRMACGNRLRALARHGTKIVWPR
jgi:hypothetical protein